MKRLLAHVVFEAKTPLKVACGKGDLFYDSPVLRDFNNLPMILGTSIAGVLRRSIKDEKLAKDLFGYEDKDGSNASRLIISNALLLDENLKVCEDILLNKSEFLQIFNTLPIRDHNAINSKGVTRDHSKFDEEIVYKGTRFKFSIELEVKNEEDQENFKKVLESLLDNSLRFGGGSSKGFGSLKIISLKYKELNLDEYSSSLNFNFDAMDLKNDEIKNKDYLKYELYLKPDDFFIFGSGFGDDEADIIPVFEKVVDYEKKKLSKEKILIPASSIKGIISHRTAFYYNKFLLDSGELDYQKVEEDNEAVRNIFGFKKDSNKNINGEKGKILISDCLEIDKNEEKVFEHVAIDRFTGGAIDGALFQEKTIFDSSEFKVDILIKKEKLCKNALDAFEKTLKDIVNGFLPLGGFGTKGHGFFSGYVLKDGEKW